MFFSLDYDSSFTDSISQAPFFLTSPAPTHIPSLEPVTNDQIIQKKYRIFYIQEICDLIFLLDQI